MADEVIRGHIRAALEEIIQQEKCRLDKVYADLDSERMASAKMMRIVADAVRALMAEVGKDILDIEETNDYWNTVIVMVAFSSTPLSEMAKVFRHQFSITPTHGNTAYEVEESWPDRVNRKTFKAVTAEEVLKLVVQAAGNRIASNQVLAESRP